MSGFVDHEEAKSQWSALTPGADGLVAAVAQDWVTGKVLMLAYQDREAFLRTAEGGRLWLWSRSRRALWLKGETSGSYLMVKAPPRPDCDGDALLYPVEPVGPACHTGKPSCFDPPAAESGAKSVWPCEVEAVLDEIIRRREISAHPDASYTARLLAGGVDKVLKKVGEETTEVILAAKNAVAADLVWELADLCYHVAVLMRCRRLERREVLEELRSRLGRGKDLTEGGSEYHSP